MLETPSAGRHRQIFWSVLGLLLFLRIPYTLAIIYFLPIENQNGAAVYEVGTYFLTAFLIWWERENLANLHIDTTALLLIIFLRPIQTLILAYWKVETPLVFPGWPSLLIWIIAIGLGLALWQSGFKSTRISFLTLAWLSFGLLIGAVTSIAENFSSFQSMVTHPRAFSSAVLLSTSLNLFYHLGFAPINEEPLFRGFLWAALRQLKWKDGWILVFQAVLFTSAHVYFAGQYPFMFWVFIPAAALLFGWLTLRSRSIAPAMLAHGMINGSVYLWLVSILLAGSGL